MNALARYFSGAKKTAQNQPWLFGIYLVLRIVVVGVAIRSIFEARYEYALLCILVLVLFAIPDFLERKLQIEIPNVLEGIILFFIFAAEILGEIDAFYVKIPFWDTMLHTL
ncbi:MAG: hypothetical protein ACLTQI_03165 [Slackia sp.]